MSRALITESYLTGIANAIRAKLGVQSTYTPPQMAAAIESIPTGGITPTGTVQITQNGNHDVTQYASANVNVQPNLQSKTVTQNGTITPDQGYDGLSQVVVNVSGGGGTDDEILYNPDFSLNTTGQTFWDATNSGTSASSRMNIIDGWNIMRCTAEIVSDGLKIVPKMAYAYLTCQIPPYWFNGKRITLKVTINGTEYSVTGTFAASGASINLNTPFGALNCYGYSASDNVFTITFINQINQEFIVSAASMKLATT